MGSAFSSQQAQRPAPAGYTPLVAFKLDPMPGGVYFELFMWILDYANDANQIATFIGHGDKVFAAVCGGSICLSSFWIWKDVHQDGKTTVWAAAHESIRRGVATEEWGQVLLAERMFEAPVTGLVAPYGMVLNKNLTLLQAGSAVLGMLLSAKATAAAQVEI